MSPIGLVLHAEQERIPYGKKAEPGKKAPLGGSRWMEGPER